MGFDILQIPNNNFQITNKFQVLKFQKSNGFVDLFRYRKPGPQGQVRDNRICYKVLLKRGLARLAGLARSPVCASIAEAYDCHHPDENKTKPDATTKLN